MINEDNIINIKEDEDIIGSEGVGPCFPVSDCLHVTTSTDVGLELGEIAVFIEFVCENLF